MLLPAPDEVRAIFTDLMYSSPQKAVSYLHELGVSSGYITKKALFENIRWTGKSSYGELECTINLSKPEKDPHDIAAAASPEKGSHERAAVSPKKVPHYGVAASSSGTLLQNDIAMPLSDNSSWEINTASLSSAQQNGVTPSAPQCDLCWENEGFPGTYEHPAKPGLRIAAITLGGECWGLQYSPYAYFTEHCIAISKEHHPMKIDESCFERLLDFVDEFPFYFIGANADLPIVGGSILSHDHFQGGRHVFPLMRSPIERDVCLQETPEVQCGIVHWPSSVLRLTSDNRTILSKAASKILNVWHAYSDESCGIVAFDDTQHNTLNPVVRKVGATYIMDLILRNNRTDVHHPWGIFHPDETMHHIKKENIGLIEIMGMAILPSRLAKELSLVQHELAVAAHNNLIPDELRICLESKAATASHAHWATDVYVRRAKEFKVMSSQGIQEPGFSDPSLDFGDNELHPIIQQEVICVFAAILETTGVFKHDAEGKTGWSSLIKKIESAQ